MKKRKKSLIKPCVSVCLAVLMIFTLITHAGTLSAMDQMDFYGIHPDITYSEDYSSATIIIHTTDVRSEEIEVSEILDSENKPLDLSNPQITVTENGEYEFTIKYSDVKATTLSSTKDDVNQVNSANDNLVESEVLKSEDERGAVEDVEALSNELSDDEVKSFVIKAVVDGINMPSPEANTTEEKLTMNQVDEVNNVANTNSRVASNVTGLSEIFDTTKWSTFNGTPIESITGLNQEITGNTIISYNPSAGGTLGSEAASSGPWNVGTTLPSKSKVSLRQDWVFKGTAFMPNNIPASGGFDASVTSGIILSKDSWQTNGLSSELAVMALLRKSNAPNETYIYSRHNGNNVPDKETGLSGQNAEFTIAYTYTGAKSGKLRLDYGGKSHELTYDNLPENAEMLIYNQVQYGDRNTPSSKAMYPVLKSGLEFQEFEYSNYQPVFVDAKWYKIVDGELKELEEGLVVKAGETLTVKATMKNNASTNGQADVMLKLSDDSNVAFTKGVNPDVNITNGILTSLSDTPITKTFTVTVRDDAIGNISLGLMMEDNFFHNKQYKHLASKIDVGQVFMDGSPKVTIVEAKRNPDTGEMDGTVDGEPVFVDSFESLPLNQDSYVRIEVKMENPRADTNLAVKVKLNTENAKGLDFGNVYSVEFDGLGKKLTAQDIRTMLTTGKTLDYELLLGGQSTFSFVVPVKQGSTGAPFNTAEQKIEAIVEGTITLNGNSASGEWSREVKISDAVVDIDSDLNLTSFGKNRGDTYDLMEDVIKPNFRTNDSSSTTDFDSIMTNNQGTLNDWKYFGLDSASDLTGTIPYFTDDGKAMEIEVSYNKSVMLNGEKHWTRMGSELDAPFRIRNKTIKFIVSGGTVLPSAYFEIPKTVLLKDEKGINDDHAGMKEEIKLVAGIKTKESFTVTADDQFSISNDSGQEHIVSLYDGSGTAYASSGLNKVLIGTFDNVNRTKTVWYDLKKDYFRESSYYSGTMNFYITMN